MIKWRPISLFFITIFLVHLRTVDLVHGVDEEEDEHNSMRLEFMHRHSSQLDEFDEVPRKQRSEVDRWQEIIRIDVKRHETISHKLGLFKGRRQALATQSIEYQDKVDNGTVDIVMQSGTDFLESLYYVGFRIGTPPQKLKVVADTCSDLTFVTCSIENENVDRARKSTIRTRRIFRAYESSSFMAISCGSDLCKNHLIKHGATSNECPSSYYPCLYYQSYEDGKDTQGIFVNETVTLGRLIGKKTKLENITLGCSHPTTSIKFGDADGILGLSYHPYSFARRAAHVFGGKFSYCLPDHFSHVTVKTYLTFGKNKDYETLRPNMKFTQLSVLKIDTFYALNMTGISLGGKMLDIPPEAWDVKKHGGTIIDCGSSITTMESFIYDIIVHAFMPYVSKFQEVKLPIDLEYCFDASKGFNEADMPQMEFHFADGVTFSPPVKSYIIKPSIDDTNRCLCFIPRMQPGPFVLGNIVTQNHFWEFDLKKKLLGFAASEC